MLIFPKFLFNIGLSMTILKSASINQNLNSLNSQTPKQLDSNHSNSENNHVALKKEPSNQIAREMSTAFNGSEKTVKYSSSENVKQETPELKNSNNDEHHDKTLDLTKKINKSSSFSNVDTCLKSSLKSQSNTDFKKFPSHHHYLHKSALLNENANSQSNLTLDENREAFQELKDKSYKYFIDSLTCDTNCCCAFHKKDKTKPYPSRIQYQHHPYYHHNSFDQNLRVSQLNLLTEKSYQKTSEEESPNQNVSLPSEKKPKKRKLSFQSLFEHGILEMLSFFGKHSEKKIEIFKAFIFYLIKNTS